MILGLMWTLICHGFMEDGAASKAAGTPAHAKRGLISFSIDF